MKTDIPIVWISHKDGDRCTGCSAEVRSGDILRINRVEGVRCLRCAGLEGLSFLPSGDPALTRRAVAGSTRRAVVVKFSRARKRHERQGVLVESEAIRIAEASCATDAGRRKALQERRRFRDAEADRRFVAEFAARVHDRYPGCPLAEADEIARHACLKYSCRVGRTGAAKRFEPEAIDLAVRAHVRHRHTRYDDLLADGAEPAEARPLIRHDIEKVLERWRADGS